MSPEPTASLIEMLQAAQLLESEQLEEVAGTLRPRFPDPQALVEELQKRTWLTPYQAERLLQGRQEDLRCGPFLLLEPLGAGGMGEVFRARHQIMDRVVALKRILPHRLGNQQAIERFLREVKAAARLSHPNIVPVYHADRVRGTFFLAMELVEGVDLARWTERHGPLPAAEASEIIRQAALALQHIHEQGLVHRDVKPSNLLRTADGRLVKLVDLGLVLLASSTTLTGDGGLMGTADYIAPEQVINPHGADIRADVYSLGCTFYHLLAGRPPFADVHPSARPYFHQKEEPPPLESFCPDLPPGLAALVRQMMAKRPEDRPATPAVAAVALSPFARGGRPPRAADTLHGWLLQELLHETGRSQFYRAARRGERATVQVLAVGLSRDARLGPRFRHVLEALAGVKHSHLGTVREFGLDEDWDCGFVVLEPLEGRWLNQELERQGQMPLDRARDLFAAVADALAAAHAAGVVHGNLQPASVFLRPDGSPLLLDFGPDAGPRSGPVERSSSAHRLFAAPEQVRKGRIDARSDVYSLAGSLYYALAYRDPVAREPELFDPQLVPEEVRDVLAAALHRNPESRPADPAAFRAALLATGQGRTCTLGLAGELFARPADDSAAAWKEQARTPGAVVLERGAVYQWRLDRSVTDAELAELAALPAEAGLVRLELRGTRVTDSGLVHLRDRIGLHELDLGITAVTDAGLAHLAGLAALRRIDLGRTAVRGEGLAHLGRLRELQDLDLSRCRLLTDAGLAHLASLVGLRKLRLSETPITDAGLAPLRHLGRLERLSLAWCREVTDAGLAHLRAARCLVELDLSNTRVTDAGMAPLGALTVLQELDLGGTGVTDAGLGPLRQLAGLRVLNLGNTQVTDAGVAELVSFARLERLGLWRCPRVRDEALPALREALPNCAISR